MSIIFDNNTIMALEKIYENLKALGLKRNEIKVYVSLTQLGEATASQVAKKADLPRTTAISILNKLEEENFLTVNKYKGTSYYWIESPKTIGELFENKVEIAKDLNKLLTDLYRSESQFPSARVYDTKSSIKQFIEKMLSSVKKKSVIYTIDKPNKGNYTKIYSENAENAIMQIKRKRDITTHTLIPHGSFRTIPEHKMKIQNIVIREMPEVINFEASFWVVDDMIIHFSGNPPFVTAIRHEAIVKSMRSLYDFLWNISAPKN